MLDLNGATIELLLDHVNDHGIRLRSGATLSGGTVRVRSRGRPSLQAGAHGPVCVGPLYGDGGTPADLSPDEGVTGWTIRDLTLMSDKSVQTTAGPIGAVAIQIMGGATNGLIERITIPDSQSLSGGIHLDWGVVGPIVSADDTAGLQANRRVYDDGKGWTTHPRDIVIRDIRVGRLTGGQGGADGGADAIRLSGCCRITVERVHAVATSGVFLRHTAGDLGLEYASGETAVTLLGNRFTACVVEDCLTGRLFVSDSLADNVARGVEKGYRPRRPTLLHTDVMFIEVVGKGRGQADGGLFVQQRGGGAVRCQARGFGVGFRCDSETIGITLTDCIAHDNRGAGFLVEHVSQPPRDCRIVSCTAFDNAGPASANIIVGASVATTIEGGTIGAADHRDSAGYGVWVKERRDGCIDASILGLPVVQSHAVGGAAFRVGSEESWGALRLFSGARYGQRIDRKWIGLSVVPTRIDRIGRVFTVSPSRRATAPATMVLLPGDRFLTGPLG